MVGLQPAAEVVLLPALLRRPLAAVLPLRQGLAQQGRRRLCQQVRDQDQGQNDIEKQMNCLLMTHYYGLVQ